MKNFIKHRTLVLISFILVTTVNIILVNLPLLNILSYESSVINALLLSLITGIFVLNKLDIEKTVFLVILFTIPLPILLFSTLFCQNCPVNDGIYFYLIIVLPSMFVGAAIAKTSIRFSNRFRYLLFLFIWIIILFSFIPELYFNPQIYFYNPIFGYYPGVIYDQNIDINYKFILYQLLNILLSISVILISIRNNFNKLTQHIINTIVILFFIVSFYYKPILGFGTDLNRIKSELKQTLSTEHFDIIIPDTLSTIQKRILEYEHEYYYYSISKLLSTKLDNKITSIIFDPSKQKKELFGAENADVAKPWLNQIYLNFTNYENSLEHEIAHIFSANFSSGLFKVPLNFNPGMIEGFAMAVENDYNFNDVNYMAALALQNGYDISIVDLFQNYSFFSNASSLSYIYAGSFFSYLSNKYGWEECKKIYSGESFVDVFNSNLDELEDEYKEFLRTVDLDDNINQANYYFSRKPLIKLFCARATAKELKQANILLKENRYSEASEKYLEIYNYSNIYSSLVGYAQSNIFLNDKKEAIKKLQNEIKNFEGTGSLYYLEFLLADIHALNEDSLLAKELYETIIRQNPHPIYLRSARLKNKILSMGNSLIIRYMSDQNDKKQILTDILNTYPESYAIQTFCLLFSEEEEYNFVMKKIEDITGTRSYDYETYYQISRLAYKNLDLKTALKYGNLALNTAIYRNKKIIHDHVAKIEWIIENTTN